MGYSMAVRESYQLGGKTFSQTKTLSEEGFSGKEVSVPAAKAGDLTTRTDDDTGELTMDVGHGITTGQRLDLYWEVAGVKGCRRGMTVGTVSVNQVPIDGGSGDVLPADETPITAMVPVEEPLALTGADVVGFAFYAAAGGTFVVATAADAELFGKSILESASAYGWHEGNGLANPVVGAIDHVFLSHGDSTGARTMRYGFLHP
jgi:hypothetical protein